MPRTLLETPLGTFNWHEHWATIPFPANVEHQGRTHGIAVARNGNVYVFHQAEPAVLVFGADGQLLESWGNYPGAHGLTLVEEDGEEFFWLTDQERLVVEKTTLDGRVVRLIKVPDSNAHDPCIPTWVAVNEKRYGGNGDVWVADGYGSSLVHRFDSEGKYISTLDGTEGAGRFACPHGIWFDFRKRPMELYVADRGNHRVQVYDADGRFQRSFGEDFLTSPDGFVSDGNLVVVPELLGRVTILDADDKLLCHMGNNENICKDPAWPDGTPLAAGSFNSPHGATTDESGSLFVVEWRDGGRIIKLEKLS